MNQKARDLNLKDSLFVNPAGFDQENIYSTARDLSVLAKELLKDEWLKAVVASKSAVIVEASGSAQHSLRNTNELLFELPEVKGVKTGTTDGAGQVLVALVEKNDRQILFVVMGSDDRYQDTKEMINWVDQAFDWVSVDFNNLIN
jgi:D-alanyl-D-alanine carboxypeptidase (penicillin-binding protein 5/6)